MNNDIANIDKVTELLSITEKLNHIKDLDSLLDNILFNARLFTHADAGSIYLKDGENLIFSYTQNETVAKRDKSHNRMIYSSFKVPINTSSIAGYVGSTGEPLNIDDVYEIDASLPYQFNKKFDVISDYRTKSVLTIPLRTSRQEIIGVMQIINAKNKKEQVIPFDENDKLFVSFFANNASIAIERAKMTREIILRMIRMAELRDPKETGHHVNRVGTYAIEIYQHYAEKKGFDKNDIKKYKDILRIAAMLHDVGKVAISDTILKKPGKLTDEEYNVMKTHTLSGEQLFDNKVSELDVISSEIAIGHHEKWDGTGYPKGLKGEETSLGGRIVAIADVFDALISTRVYKDAWTEEDVLLYMKEQAGKQFDPELIDSFFSILDVINAIRNKYRE